MKNLTIFQTDVCSKFFAAPRSSRVDALWKAGLRKCVGCSSAKRDTTCRFFRTDEEGDNILEQRSFIISPGPAYALLEVRPYEHSAHIPPVFDPPPPTLTNEIVTECLVAVAYVLVPQLERHRALRDVYKSSIFRTPEMSGERLTCDHCRMSCLCSVLLCRNCGMEICDTCIQEKRINTVCVASRLTREHDFALLEFFQPNELESALSILRQVPPPKQLSCPCDADIVKVELSDGAGLPSYSALYRSIASGIPMVVSGINPGDDNLTPEYFIQRHGQEIVTVINTVTGEDRTLPLATFMQPFCVPDSTASPEKLKDWPPTKNFVTAFPDMFNIFKQILIGPLLTSKSGPLNLETSMPEGSCPPDTGPKAYLAHGASEGATTRLHCDMTDAVNIMPFSKRGKTGEGGALWTMISRDDMPRAETLLRDWKRDAFKGHPVHSQEIVVTPEDVHRLRQHGVKVWTFIQREGEAVFIPAGVGHQVTNLSSCIKIAVDFVAPCNVMHTSRIGEELRQHRLATLELETEDEDVLQLSSMCWWYYIRSQTDQYRRARSDCASDPWDSLYSAAPRYLQVPIRIDISADERAGETSTHEESAFGLAMSDTAIAGLSLSPAPVLPAQVPSPLPQLQHSSTTTPAKRLVEDDDQETRTEIRLKRRKKLRTVLTNLDSTKPLICPIGVVGNCKRSGDAFDRQGLLDHLEKAHGEYVQYKRENMTKSQQVEKRKKILSHPGDFVAYLSQTVLIGLPSPLP